MEVSSSSIKASFNNSQNFSLSKTANNYSSTKTTYNLLQEISQLKIISDLMLRIIHRIYLLTFLWLINNNKSTVLPLCPSSSIESKSLTQSCRIRWSLYVEKREVERPLRSQNLCFHISKGSLFLNLEESVL